MGKSKFHMFAENLKSVIKIIADFIVRKLSLETVDKDFIPSS